MLGHGSLLLQDTVDEQVALFLDKLLVAPCAW